jgi:hypothetical protein
MAAVLPAASHCWQDLIKRKHEPQNRNRNIPPLLIDSFVYRRIEAHTFKMRGICR